MCICVYTPVITAKHPALANPSSPHSADYIIEPDTFVLIWQIFLPHLARLFYQISLSGFMFVAEYACLFHRCVFMNNISVPSYLCSQMFNLRVHLIRFYEVCACALDCAYISACISVSVCVSVSRMILKILLSCHHLSDYGIQRAEVLPHFQPAC